MSQAPSTGKSEGRGRSESQQIALDDLTRTRTWAELEDRTNRVARFLREDLGLAPGDHAAVLMANRVECVELMVGAIHAGIWLTPLNWHLTPEEVAYVVEDSGARVLFADSKHEETARQCNPGTLLLAGEELDTALAGASDAPMDREGPAGGPMIYTSGTTGRPKGVQRYVQPTLGLALEAQRKAGEAICLTGQGPHLITGPCYHAAPLLFAIYDQANGAPIVIMPEWREEQALELLQEREIGQTHLVPTMFVRLLRLPEETRAQFSAPALQAVLHGAAPIARATKQQMIEWWGEILIEYWGATESGVITLTNSREWLEHPETVGSALPAWEVFATNEAGERLPPGENGLLHARHRHIEHLFQYHGAPEKTAECYLAPDIFNIGDIGRVEPDGYVYLADRKSNMIISGGVNIYPAEIEQALAEHPAVADIAVFGIPNDEWGESVKAAVELTPGHTASPALEAELRNFARAHLASYKVPRSIDFEEHLPRHPSGKLYVRKLRDPYWEGRAKRI